MTVGEATTGCKVAGCTSPDKVTIDASAEVSTGFARIFGIDNIKVKAHAAACGPCDTSVHKFDVMVVLDRSGSMCTDANGRDNGCADLNGAKDGIRSLLKFFDPSTDRVGLAVLSSGTPSAAGYPCEGPIGSGVAGADFMAQHGAWVLAPLANDFKKSDGSLNSSSQLVHAVDCLKAKTYTPIAPAIQDATAELQTHGRHDANVTQVMVFLGDGGANVQPMKSDGHGGWQTSWYHPLVGDASHIQPCHDAVAQAGAAKAAKIDVYVLGYDLNNGTSQTCNRDNHPADNNFKEAGIDATSALSQMASGSDHFFQTATPDQITTIFNKIGHQITSGGSRLVE